MPPPNNAGRSAVELTRRVSAPEPNSKSLTLPSDATAELAARLAKGIFAKPGIYPAIVRFGNADPKVNSDFKPDVRSLSFSVDLTRDGTAVPGANVGRQDFSLQNATTLPINDAPAFLATMKVLTASNPAAGLWSLPFKDKLRVLRTLALGAIAGTPDRSNLISNCAIGATYRFVTDRSML